MAQAFFEHPVLNSPYDPPTRHHALDDKGRYRSILLSQSILTWAPPIQDLYLAFGIGKIIALFLVRFGQPIEGNPDDELWVVVGDMPTAYFVTEAAPDPAEALTAYCELMEDWADRILEGRDLEGSYPISVEPTVEHAKMLKSRMGTIRQEFVPLAKAGDVIP